MIQAACDCGLIYHVRRLPVHCECGAVLTAGTVSEATTIRIEQGSVPPGGIPANRRFKLGPGTHLRRMIAEADRWAAYARWIPGLQAFSFAKSEACYCEQRAAEMDAHGIQWCRDNVATILQWLKEGAEQAGVPFVAVIARLLIRTAIQLAQQDADRAEQQPKAAEIAQGPT